MTNKKITLGSLFDGIGGFPLAAQRTGIKPVWASEIVPACVSITKRHFPNIKHLGDITNINGAEIEPVDIITFGSPCQDLSVAGRRAGLEGKRSSLFMEAVRVIKEMRKKYGKPDFIVWENVQGAFSSNKGKDFRKVIEEIAKIAQAVSIPEPYQNKWMAAGAVMGNGWSLAWRVLDAQYWGVPQRRKRIFLVADFAGERACEILFKPESLSGNFTESGETGKGIAGNVENSVIQYAVDFGRTADRIQMNAGKAVTLQGEGGGCGAKTGLYCLPVSVHQNQCGEVRQGNVANTLNTNGNASSRNAPLVATIDCRNHDVNGDISGTLQSKSNGGNSLNYINPVFAMQGFGDYKPSNIASSMKSREGKDSTDLITSDYSVRRLTPTECERLQGFPDAWTEYGHDGKTISDSARYRALGNSVAIPCVEYVLAGIKAVVNKKHRRGN